MRITRFSIVLSIVFMGVLAGCSGDNGGSPSGTSIDQFVVASTLYDSWSYANALDSDTMEEWAYVYGMVHAAELPIFKYCVLCDTTFRGADYCCYYPGYLAFGLGCQSSFPSQENVCIITSVPDTITLEVSTSLGTVEGSVVIPDTLTGVSMSSDTLAIGQSLTISWAGTADFYWIEWYYDWFDGATEWGSIWCDTMVASNSLTIDGRTLSHDGELHITDITPMNGPYPRAGAPGNMTGTGSGFLYCSNFTNYYSWRIPVGDWYSKPASRTRAARSIDDVHRDLLSKIHKKLGAELR